MIHKSVLLKEAVAGLRPVRGGVYVDGTLGRGGHTLELLRQVDGEAYVIGIDRDEVALKESKERLAEFAGQVKLVHGEHSQLAKIVAKEGLTGKVDGVLLDLGVSSPQLDDGERGFSFMRSGPLDMRMDQCKGETAANLCARLSEEELREILWEFGEERNAKQVARAIVKARDSKPITTTEQLVQIVEQAVKKHGAHNPATRTFQALRMAVNDEIGELRAALEGALEVLKEGGRLAVITFESITDRITKQFCTTHEPREVALITGGIKLEFTPPAVLRTPRKPIYPTPQELADNPRSRSAKLRIVEKKGERYGEKK